MLEYLKKWGRKRFGFIVDALIVTHLRCAGAVLRIKKGRAMLDSASKSQASLNAVIFALPPILIRLKGAVRKDARSSEKPFQCHLKTPLLSYNLWKLLAFTWFFDSC